MTEERLEILVVKVVDGTASPAEREELMSHAASHPEVARELERHRAVKALTDGWVARLELDLSRHEQRPSVRAERALGWALLLVGIALLSGFGVWAVLSDPEIPLAVRLGTGAASAGAVLLLLSAIRWRLSTAKHDRYEEVIR